MAVSVCLPVSLAHMGTACSCPPGHKAEDENSTLDVGFETEKVLQAPEDIVAAAAKLAEDPTLSLTDKETPTAIANTDPDTNNTSNVFNPELENSDPKAGNLAEDRAEKPAEEEEEAFQDKAYREIWEKAKSGRKADEAKPGKFARRPSSENITMEAYTQKHAGLFDKVLTLERPDGWNLKKEHEGVKIYTKEMPGERLLYFKGVTEICVAGGLTEILSKLFKTEDRPKWDELCNHAETPQSFPPFYKYAYCNLLPPASIIAKRDILTIGRFRFEKDGAVVAALKSDELEAHPRRADFVRINFIEGGYVIRPKNGRDDVFDITWTGLVDPQGWLPTWVANLAVIKQGIALAKLRAFILSTGQ